MSERSAKKTEFEIESMIYDLTLENENLKNQNQLLVLEIEKLKKLFASQMEELIEKSLEPRIKEVKELKESILWTREKLQQFISSKNEEKEEMQKYHKKHKK